MTESRRDAVVDRACAGKVAHRSARAARHHVDSLLAADPTVAVGPYRCPFCGAWHVGHVPSIESLALIAAAVRGVDPHPQPHDPPPSGKRRRRRTSPEAPSTMPDSMPEPMTRHDRDPGVPMAGLRDRGVLWAINRVLFHPRGFALAVDRESGDLFVHGDGSEPWTFTEQLDDQHFAEFEALLDEARLTNRTERS
jgi:hypothetical protein